MADEGSNTDMYAGTSRADVGCFITHVGAPLAKDFHARVLKRLEAFTYDAVLAEMLDDMDRGVVPAPVRARVLPAALSTSALAHIRSVASHGRDYFKEISQYEIWGGEYLTVSLINRAVEQYMHEYPLLAEQPRLTKSANKV